MMDESIKKETMILEKICDIFIFLIIVIFPLLVDSTGFFGILECKWHWFVNLGSLFVLSNVIVLLYFLIVKNVNYFKYIKVSLTQWLLVLLLLVNILSCFLSPYFGNYDLFVGVGRGEGLIVTSLYILSFLIISLFGKFKKKYLLYFAVSSILVSLICILQYVGFNPFNMYQDGIGTHNVSFMGTIGNKDFISAIYTILLTISVACYIFLDDSKINSIIYIASIFCGFFIFGVINVSSGKLAFGVTLLVMLPVIIFNSKRISKLLVVIATILMAYCLNVIINPVFYYNLGEIVLKPQFNVTVVLFIIVSASLVYLSKFLNKYSFDQSKNKSLYKYYYIALMVLFIIGIFGVYIINFRSGFLYEIHEILHGNLDDTFGTYRVFLWKRTLTLFGDYPILGSGPDSFALRFMAKYTSDVASIGTLTINDTAANVYLTMLINVGLAGLLSYLSFIISLIYRFFKQHSNYSLILFAAFICYIIQDFFNLSVVIVSPLYWIVAALLYKSTDSVDITS